MFRKDKIVAEKYLRNIYADICVLESEYELKGHLTKILKVTVKCIGEKFDLDLLLTDKKKKI